MDDHTYQNWLKIKSAMEQSGNTNNMIYQRACEIAKTRKDPLSKFFGEKDDS